LAGSPKNLALSVTHLEKACRLAGVLSFMKSVRLLADSLALKGGTVINEVENANISTSFGFV